MHAIFKTTIELQFEFANCFLVPKSIALLLENHKCISQLTCKDLVNRKNTEIQCGKNICPPGDFICCVGVVFDILDYSNSNNDPINQIFNY